jgi:hypothetical protein
MRLTLEGDWENIKMGVRLIKIIYAIILAGG